MWEDEGEAVGNCVEMRGDEECAVALLILILIMMQDTCRIELFLGLKVISDVGAWCFSRFGGYVAWIQGLT